MPRDAAREANKSRGAALAYVILLLAVLGILVGLGWRYIRFNDSLVALDRWDTQARLLARSGIDYALSRIGYPPGKQNLAFATDNLTYHVEDSSLSFQLSVRTWGLYARATSSGRTRLPWQGRVKEISAIVGESMDLGALPALGLMNHEGNLVLAGAAEVSGPVMLWRGDVRKATDYHISWKGKTGHAGPVWDSLSPIWKRISPGVERADAWIKAQEALQSDASTADPDYDSGSYHDLRLPDSTLLVDTLLENTRILGNGTLRIATGCRIKHCKILAKNIILDTGSNLEQTLVFASRKLKLKNPAIVGGQFIALDSLTLSIDEPMRLFPLFYVHGRKVNAGHPDSSFLGALIVEKARGEGFFISMAAHRPDYDQESHLVIGPKADLKGFCFCNGYARMEGKLQGSLICHNLRFEYDGTIWLGHLKDGHLTACMGNTIVTAPLLFPGWSPIAATDPRP